jgi:hypothetical protein
MMYAINTCVVSTFKANSSTFLQMAEYTSICIGIYQKIWNLTLFFLKNVGFLGYDTVRFRK